MAEFPALPLWTDALIGDTYHLTPAEFGAYLRLLIVAWRRPGCDLPDSDPFLGRSIGDPKNWHRLKPVVMAFFAQGDDGLYRQKRLLDERDYCSRLAARSSAGGIAKSLKRKNRDSAKRVPNECQTAAPIPTPTTLSVFHTDRGASPKAKTPKATKSRRSVPDDFPTETDQDWARDFWLQRGRADLCTLITDEISKFRDHHTGHGKSMADWPAAWRTWTRNAIKFNNGAHNGRQKPQSAHDKFLAAGESIIREIMGETGESGAGDDSLAPRHQLLSP